MLIIFSLKYKYNIKEEYLSKNNNYYLTFEIDNNKITKLDKYKLIINKEEINYKITNIEQGLNKSKVTILPEKNFEIIGFIGAFRDMNFLRLPKVGKVLTIF